MRGIEQDQPPFHNHSESGLELLIDEKIAVTVIQNIIDDQSCWFKFTQRSGIEKDRCFFLKLFDLSWKQTEMLCEAFRLTSPTAQGFWSITGEDEQF